MMQQPEITPPEKIPSNIVPPENVPGSPLAETPIAAAPAVPPQISDAAPIAAPLKPGLWLPWPTVGLGLAIFAINGLAQTIVVLVFAVLQAVNGAALSTRTDIQSFTQDLLSDGRMLSLAIILSAAAGIAITYLFIKIRKGFSFAQYLGLKSTSLKTFLAVLGIYVVGLGVSLGVAHLAHSSQDGDIFTDAYRNTPWPVVFWLAVVVFGPFFEEILFRGFLFVGLRQSALGTAGTIVVTGLVFALLHSAQYGMAAIAEIFVLGLVFGLVRWRTGSLWTTIFMHGLWNLGQMVLIAFFPTFGG